MGLNATCHVCGCPDLIIQHVGTGWNNRPFARCKCSHCGSYCTVQDGAGDGRNGSAIYMRTLCPWCGSSQHRVVKTMPGKRVRYHRCGECQLPFKSVDHRQRG